MPGGGVNPVLLDPRGTKTLFDWSRGGGLLRGSKGPGCRQVRRGEGSQSHPRNLRRPSCPGGGRGSDLWVGDEREEVTNGGEGDGWLVWFGLLRPPPQSVLPKDPVTHPESG